MRTSGGLSARSAANRAAAPRAAAAAPVRRKSRRETIAAGRVVVGFVMSVVSGFGSRRHVRRVQPLFPPGCDGVPQNLGLGRLLFCLGCDVLAPFVVVWP